MKGARAPAPGEPRLVFGDRDWMLREGEHVIGRDEAAAIRIDAAGVSRHHARLTVRDGRSIVEDLGSKNGTFCGGERLAAPRLLADGDVLQLGQRVRLVFRQRGGEETVSELPLAAADFVFRRDGDLWTMKFEGRTVHLADVKGFGDLARLLSQPGTEVHCVELAERVAESATPDPILDERARREIQQRARELQHEIDEADARHDAGRAERAREELDQIVEALSGAVGLRGRARGLGSESERARSAVAWRIRNAMKRIGAAHPRLGRHLENAVRTGTFCAYVPEAPVHWVI